VFTHIGAMTTRPPHRWHSRNDVIRRAILTP